MFSMLKKLGLYYRTIKHLKPIQIQYRLWYALRSRFRGPGYYLNASPDDVKSYCIKLQEWISKPASYDNLTFTFLNESKTFTEPVDWNYSEYGKLWAYHLNYFDYLIQPGMCKEAGALLISEFIESLSENREGLEPYPISLRGINWIKFLNQHDMHVPEVSISLYAQYQVLLNYLEYHLMGNHLLENGCSLMFGAWYFRDREMLEKGTEVLMGQLDEQVLDDGAHFELSPMYHRILLDRLLDVYNLVINNREWHTDAKLERKLKDTLQKMLGWMQAVTFSNRDLPLVNDSVEGVGPENDQLFRYASRLGLHKKEIVLSDSGYRKIDIDSTELFLDVGNIGPDYIPGHAHSDTFSFILYGDGGPLIVDPGVSTYEANEKRLIERSTSSHNTVVIDGEDQSEVWASFRVGRRAYIKDLKEQQGLIQASHTGYLGPKGLIHQRSWQYEEDCITMHDEIVSQGESEAYNAIAHLHFAPAINVCIQDDIIYAGQKKIQVRDYIRLEKKVYSYCKGYNKTIMADKVEISFKGRTTTIIYL